MGFSIGVLNNIRTNASTEYQERIPVATQENIQSIGYALQSYTPMYNEFSTALLCKIGKTMVESKLFKNRLARFKSGTIVDAQDVEEIFVEMARAEGPYDPNGTNPLGRRETIQDKVVYHRENRRDKYVVSIGDLDFRKVFRSEATLDAYITKKINALFSGANKDEFLVMRNLLNSYDGYFHYDVPYIFKNSENVDVMVIGNNDIDPIQPGTLGVYQSVLTHQAKTFAKTVRKAVMDVTLDSSTQFNKAGVETWAEAKDLVLLVNPDILAEVDVEVLSKAMNIDKTDINIPVIPVKGLAVDFIDSQRTQSNTLGLLIDKDFFRVWDTLSHMEPQRNADGLFTNYFYHVHQIVSCSPFKTAIVFSGVYEQL